MKPSSASSIVSSSSSDPLFSRLGRTLPAMDDGEKIERSERRALLQRIEVPTLRRLDDAVVPRLQRGARRGRQAVARPLRAVARWEERSWFGPVARNRGALAFVAVLVATAASAVHFDRYPDIRAAEAEAERQTVRPVGEDLPGEPTSEQVASVGPPLDVVVDDYITGRHDALREIDGADDASLVAVVSFDTYLTPEQVSEVLGDGLTILVAQYRIPAEGEPPLETEVVGGDLEGSVHRAVEQALAPLREEEREVERLLESDTVEDDAYVEDYERRLSELRSVRNVVETGAPVVFAVVVEASPELLQGLVGQQHVRLVDPAPPGIDPDRSSFFGVRPEDTDRATYGRTS